MVAAGDFLPANFKNLVNPPKVRPTGSRKRISNGFPIFFTPAPRSARITRIPRNFRRRSRTIRSKRWTGRRSYSGATPEGPCSIFIWASACRARNLARNSLSVRSKVTGSLTSPSRRHSRSVRRTVISPANMNSAPGVTKNSSIKKCFITMTPRKPNPGRRPKRSFKGGTYDSRQDRFKR